MGNNQLISVVVTTYNSAKYVRDCLNGTIGQTYQDLEIIIVDDGSDDTTRDICRSYEKKDGRIVLLTQDNCGVSAARNRGIQEAKGEFVVFFDADDYPEKNLIESFVKAKDRWKDKKLSLILSGMYCENRFNKNVGDVINVMEISRGYMQGEEYILSRNSAAILSWLKLFNFVTNKFFDLSIIRENNLLFDEDVQIGEDLKFVLDYLDVCNGAFGLINSPLYHYVKRSDSNLSVSYHESDIEDTKDIYIRYLKWISGQNGVTEDNILVVKSIFVTDWVSRLTSMYEATRKTPFFGPARRRLSRELHSKEFQTLLKQVYKARKISPLRYYTLRTGSFELFFFFRGVYQIYKG